MTMTCQIQWINRKGRETPDKNQAVGIAICRSADGETPHMYPICAAHLEGMSSNWSFISNEEIASAAARVKRLRANGGK